MRILVTGIHGFIGSYFAKYVLSMDPDVQIVGFGRDSDVANRRRLASNPRLKLVHGDLIDASGLCEHIDVVVNFAAKTFVDHSLKDRRPFVRSNILGADALMDDAQRYGVKLFVQVSTDEVYGQILIGSYKEDALLDPRNPYAWTKACADLSALQRHRTSGFPCIVTRTENNFGPWQHRQKALPTFVRTALSGQPIPVYGDGKHVRCWLHVEEHCRAIWHLVVKSAEISRQNREADRSNYHFGAEQGARKMPLDSLLGQVFHVAGEDELTNIELAELVLETLDLPKDRIHLVPDHNIRPGHDRRYALNCDKIKATGFSIKQDVRVKLAETVRWYAGHQEWMR